MRRKKEIQKETVFGSMKVIKEVDSKKRPSTHGCRRFFLMECVCGKECIVGLETLKSGDTTSCGCVKRAFLINYNTGKDHSGEKSYRWIKDRTKLSKYKHGKERRSPAYKNWAKEVKVRDGLNCKINNADCCGELDSHHILNWQEYPELRFDVNNGITLCQFHHPRGKNQEKEQSIYLKGLINKKMPC